MFKKFVIILILSSIYTVLTVSLSIAVDMSVPVEIIEKSQADYLSPENALAAFFSASIEGDLQWRNESITASTLLIKTEISEKAGVDLTHEMDLIRRNLSEAIIVQRNEFNSGVMLVVDVHSPVGDIFTLPYIFVQQNGLWKLTSEFKNDPEILTYIDLEPHTSVLFDGTGQRASDVNKFLQFEFLTHSKTDLASGVNSYSLSIFYGDTVTPESFRAELNKVDISNLFNPSPSDSQIVEIPLNDGKNVLVLQIDGLRTDGKIATDKDRLEFNVGGL